MAVASLGDAVHGRDKSDVHIDSPLGRSIEDLMAGTDGWAVSAL